MKKKAKEKNAIISNYIKRLVIIRADNVSIKLKKNEKEI